MNQRDFSSSAFMHYDRSPYADYHPMGVDGFRQAKCARGIIPKNSFAPDEELPSYTREDVGIGEVNHGMGYFPTYIKKHILHSEN